ncbi:MAG: Polynucleotide adenylyltransferase/metal dependent phosphohydrolase [Candidatus Daviesbacteria bacterium GW2011_GWA1_41_61]|uniref:Polynucleotide adenylyltransferase/metal dependent phosphohydrolase n=1 Tax=Candidatus Daviesbacteria bacterium GW2011_GWA2_40_9 TaxID=1618424 RepID=A0A0G0U380_9BACT|nr:MAG: polyA polymerase family protein, poly(A) polymerase [Candidatus Daviesbacteria bacterium GW2011_GWC1_40_9]KKR83558.1 MAG: Polynucleotide adenylyltransferase/metal dependent phosphohydrolase [Candidatus Daviesbacteria bacterium GW2011_GWA2_40_9]KKR93127.1 MAG: Polynucleotide adenylyltransferase/metal dependent phosphohydrolase [Candidatus Daviesbacteria bacterium GW2011_GWB1_41_15]KKS15671.1 MAG: Polynucleotide adenylyltransferase/metal dependent phosphohydrolase [Candidatus Daviesbacteri
MEYQLPKEVKKILNKLTQAGYQAYIVGGAVRDLLMGREVSDWDFTTDAKPEEILKVFPEGFYDNRFGTVGIAAENIGKYFARGDTEEDSRRLTRTTNDSEGEDGRRDTEVAGPRAKRVKQIFEITTMRKEGVYRDFRHPIEVSWTNKIEEDLARRDFTINAMALSITEELIDPFGGQRDLQNKLIQAVGDPKLRFQEDALRLMRAIRIATELGFEIENKTWQAIQENAPLIRKIAWERIRDELLKILASLYPYIGIVKLREAGILPIILPEVERCFGVVQKGPKHARVYDIGEHSLLTLKETPSSDPLTRLAALLHDIGKPDTLKIGVDSNVTFYHHEVVGGKLSLQIAKRFNLSKDQTDKLYRLARWHLFTVDEKQTDSAIRRFIKNIGVENIDDMMALRVGDRLGGGTQKAVSWRMERFKERIKDVLKKPFSVTDLNVNGKDVMEVLKIKPGPKVGEILNKLFKEVLEDASKNNRDYLLEKIKSLK